MRFEPETSNASKTPITNALRNTAPQQKKFLSFFLFLMVGGRWWTPPNNWNEATFKMNGANENLDQNNQKIKTSTGSWAENEVEKCENSNSHKIYI